MFGVLFRVCSAFVPGEWGFSGRKESSPAALLELAAASTGARLIATDGRRCGNRRTGRSEALPSPLVPAFLAFEFFPLLFGLPEFVGFLLFEHFGIPQRFPFGELLRCQWPSRRLAPDFKILLHPVLRARLAGRRLRRNALSAPVGLVLLAASLLPLLVGQVEPGPPAFDPVGGTLDPVFTVSAPPSTRSRGDERGDR